MKKTQLSQEWEVKEVKEVNEVKDVCQSPEHSRKEANRLLYQHY